MFNRSKRSAADSVARLQAQLAAIGTQEEGPFESGFPARWSVEPHRRCLTGHVTTEWTDGRNGTKRCRVCAGETVLTFPEDRGGPLGYGEWVPASSTKVRSTSARGSHQFVRSDRLRLRQPGRSGA